MASLHIMDGTRRTSLSKLATSTRTHRKRDLKIAARANAAKHINTVRQAWVDEDDTVSPSDPWSQGHALFDTALSGCTVECNNATWSGNLFGPHLLKDYVKELESLVQTFKTLVDDQSHTISLFVGELDSYRNACGVPGKLEAQPTREFVTKSDAQTGGR